MKGVIYARYSSDNQREESIEGQLRECKEYAERNDITILGTYIDRALSAKTDNRPEFQHMIKDSAKGLFDVVLVWKLDRFARNRYDSARYKNLLKKNGVRVISARENISEGSEGIILEAMLEGYAEYYSAELSEKVIRGLTDNALKCKYNGGTVPMGYYIDEQQYYQIDPKTAPVVLEMFTKYSEGATMQELVNLLNSRGMRSIRGGKITLNIMNHLLKNRRYMGEYSYRDVVKEDGIPAIVPKELFERVQERLAKNKRAPARHKAEDDYLLTTKLYCGKCGSFMVGESGTSHTMKVHRYYRCVNTKKKKLCDKKAVKKDWIEDLVVNYTMKAIMNDEVMERLIDTLMELQKKESTDLPLLKKQLAETEKGINNMLNAIQAGIFTPSTKQRLDELEETKSQLEVSILQEEMHKPLLTREQIAFFIYRFRKFDVTKREQRQRLIDSFVNAVYLYEDKIILTFNYKDGSKTITLAEVEGSDLSVLGAPRKSRTRSCSAFSFRCERGLDSFRSKAGLCETPSPLIKQDPLPQWAEKGPPMQINDLFGAAAAFETVRMPGGTEAAIPTEHAAVIYVNEQPAFRVVCTPQLLPQLALGRLLTEGWIASAEEVEQIAVCAEGLKVNIYLNHPLTARRAAAQEVSSCCTDNVALGSPVEVQPLRAVPHLDVQPEWVDALAAAMNVGLPLYQATHAVHSCFVLHEGRILCACEDIGRHNALDKAVGSVFLAGVSLSECVLYTSGRVPMDMVRKAIRAGVPALVSKTMPTVQSLELAQEYGLQLLCGRKHPLTSSKSAG